MTTEDRAAIAAIVARAAADLGRDCDAIEKAYQLQTDPTRELVSAVMDLARSHRDLALHYVGDQLPEAVSRILGGQRLFASVLMLLASENPASGLAELRSAAAREAALASHANRPIQADKRSAYEYWLRWQKDPDLYEGPTRFARDMMEKHKHLESERVVVGWCRDWPEGKNLPLRDVSLPAD